MIPTLFWATVYVTVVLLVGYVATCMLLRQEQPRSFPEFAGLCLLLGLGTTGTLLIWVSFLGLRPGRGVIVSLGVLAVASLLMFVKSRRLAVPSWPRWEKPAREIGMLAVPMLLLLGANIAAAIPALAYPFLEWDAYVIWDFKARVLHHEALRWHTPAYFHDVSLSFTHLDYPLLLPMLVAGMFGAVGNLNEQLGKIVLPMFLAGHSLLIYTGARFWLTRLRALMITILLIGAPFVILSAGHGTADAPLTAFYAGAIVYLLRWTLFRRRSDIIISALFCGFVASTKSEGLPIVAIHVFVLAIFVLLQKSMRRDWIDLGWFTLIVSILAGLWVVWRVGLPHTNDDYWSRLRWPIISQNIGRLRLIVEAMWYAFIGLKSWGAIWMLIPVSAVVGFRAFARRELWVLWALFLLHLMLYLLVYIITDWDVQELLVFSLYRMLLHVAPLAALLIAAHWSAAGQIVKVEQA